VPQEEGAGTGLIMRSVIAIAVWLLATVAARAVTITVQPGDGSQPAVVSVDGDLEENDGDYFRSKTSFLSKAIVAFRTDGGSVVAGIQIGESIRLKGFTTTVAGSSRCASACALAWLGGARRLLSADARIGFHAAYNKSSGQETGVGNALIGAYLNKIGLPYSAVIYITQAAPASMTWLSMADAKKRGIDVEPVGSRRVVDTPAPTVPSPTVRNVPPPSIDKLAIARACSEQATARGLHGDDRREFRAECKKKLEMF
jgi:hypothetical protein